MLKILVVEDDWEMNRSICYILEENGYETVSAHSIAEAQKAHEDGKADLVLLDVNLPDGEGFGFCEWLHVRDTGKGIALERQAQIFTRFYREPEVHDQDGVGIGLYLTRKIAELQGGYVEVRSEAGKGADFCICLPNA